MQMSKKSWLIAMTAVAGLGVIACGGDEEDTTPATTPGPVDSSVSSTGDSSTSAVPSFGDAGVNIGALLDSGILQNLADSGALRSPDGGSILSGLLGDSGALGALADSGVSSLEAGTIGCPAPYVCSEAIKMTAASLGLGSTLGNLSACAKTANDLPDTCTTPNSPCMVGTKSGMCTSLVIANYCVVPCN
jgi:hypothetical protein